MHLIIKRIMNGAHVCITYVYYVLTILHSRRRRRGFYRAGKNTQNYDEQHHMCGSGGWMERKHDEVLR